MYGHPLAVPSLSLSVCVCGWVCNSECMHGCSSNVCVMVVCISGCNNSSVSVYVDVCESCACVCVCGVDQLTASHSCSEDEFMAAARIVELTTEAW